MVLSNLVENAIKFTPPGGMVEIGAQADVEQDSDDVQARDIRLWVRDSGPGVEADDQAHIFERFYRGRKSGVQGSGLGLSIAKSIVELHGGEISLGAQAEAGACFVIELPAEGLAASLQA